MRHRHELRLLAYAVLLTGLADALHRLTAFLRHYEKVEEKP